MMKRYVIALCFAIFMCGISPVFAANGTGMGQAQAGGIKWYKNYGEATQVAAKARKPILLFFTGSDWCGWCKKMHQEVFKSPDFINQVGDSFIFVEVDFPMNQKLPQELADQNATLKKQFGVTGYPTIIILDSNANFIAETGYQPGGGASYANYLKGLLK